MKRATALDVTEYRKLQDWAQHVVVMFRGEVPYLVGSVLTDFDYRDVDVRLILEDAPDVFGILSSLVDLKRLGFVVSLWGQQMTGLRIDFQVQSQAAANEEFLGRRHPIGLAVVAVEEVGE